MEIYESQLLTECIHVICPTRIGCDTQLLSWQLAEMCGEIMYFAQAIKQPDKKRIVEAIVKEVNGQVENQNWELIKRSEVPVGDPIQQSVWAMRRKRNLTTGEVLKHKARLNLHGGMQ